MMVKTALNGNIGVGYRKYKTDNLFSLYFLRKYQIMFEFDPDCSTFKWLPKINTAKIDSDKVNVIRLIFMWFGISIMKGGKSA